jgi:hypothetical protein
MFWTEVTHSIRPTRARSDLWRSWGWFIEASVHPRFYIRFPDNVRYHSTSPDYEAVADEALTVLEGVSFGRAR